MWIKPISFTLMFYKMISNLYKSCPPEYQELCPVHLESQVAGILCVGYNAYSFVSSLCTCYKP